MDFAVYYIFYANNNKYNGTRTFNVYNPHYTFEYIIKKTSKRLLNAF